MNYRLARAGIAGITLFVIFTAAPAGLPASADGQPLPTLAPMIEEVAPAVVNIATRGSVEVRQNPFLNDPFWRQFFPEQPRRREFQSAGSGVIVDAEAGIIVTNHHVVAETDRITVNLQDDRNFEAEVIGSDPGSDIAVLRVEADDLVDIKIADSDSLRVGDFVVAIGNPFGLEHTVTSGIVSGLGRSGLNPNGYEDFIQTDASINPGNSGGALVNLRGELVGINSAIFTARGGGNIGIGFAIPANMASTVMAQLLEFGEVKRGLLGVNIYTVTPDIAEAYGVEENQGALVSSVAENSAAEKAGIEVGDIITSVDGKPVKGASELRNAIGLRRSGEKIRIQLVRDGRTRKVSAVLGEQGSTQQLSGAEIHSGLEGSELADADESRDGADGVLVTRVEEGSPAARQQLRRGDVIIGVNRKSVTGLRSLREAAEGSTSLLLDIRRGKRNLLLPIR